MKPFSAVVSEGTVSIIRDKTQMGVALHIHNLRTCEWVINTAPSAALPQERDSFAIVQVDGWASGPVWAGMENLAPLCGSNQGSSSIRVVAPPTQKFKKN